MVPGGVVLGLDQRGNWSSLLTPKKSWFRTGSIHFGGPKKGDIDPAGGKGLIFVTLKQLKRRGRPQKYGGNKKWKTQD